MARLRTSDNTTGQALYRIGGTPNGGGTVLVTVAGRTAAGPFLIRQERAWAVGLSGAAALDTVGTDIASGAGASSVSLVWDTTTYAGEIQIRVKLAAAVEISGRVKVTADGNVRAVRRGEPVGMLI